MLSITSLDTLEQSIPALQALLDFVKNPADLDKAIQGIAEARAVIAEKNAALDDLAELKKFKATKDKQLTELKTASDKNDADAIANAARATHLDNRESELATSQTKLEADDKKLTERETAVTAKEAQIETTQKKAASLLTEAETALADANKLKQQYLDKLSALADVENGKTAA